MEDRVLVDRYRLVRRLGQGGMGEVWEAYDEGLQRPVAVKVVSVLAGEGSRAGEARARFLREARITAALQHPGIVTVHDLGEAATGDGTTPFLVMELLRGQGLDSVIRHGTVAPAQVARWGAQVCDALGEAHTAGVLHRDVKPANLFVTASGTVKVLDFGIARAAEASATSDRLTHTGFVVGTASYMAPEQARGRPERRSDLYALGCVLFEMLAGRLPFTAPDTLGFITAHLHDVPPALSTVAPGVPPAWDRVVLRLLAKDPGQRYESAAQLAAELRRLDAPPRRPLPEPPRPPAPGNPAEPATLPAPGTTRALPPAGVRTAREPAAGGGAEIGRRALLWGGVGLAGLAAAGGWTALYLKSGHPAGDPVAWSHDVGEVSLNSDVATTVAVLGAGHCYVASGMDTAVLHAFDTADGALKWKVHLDATWSSGAIWKPTFAAVDGTVLVLARGHDEPTSTLFAFDASNGKLRWRREKAGAYLHAHRPSGLVISCDGARVFAVDPRTGKERWEVGELLASRILLIGDTVLTDEGRALHAETGHQLWDRHDVRLVKDRVHPLGKGILCYESGETVTTDVVFRDARTGKEVWRSPFQEAEDLYTGDLRPMEAVVSGGTVFMPLAAGNRRAPSALDGATGKQKWTYDRARYRPDKEDGAAAGVADGFVLPTAEGPVCLSADHGTERWRDDAGPVRAVYGTGPYALVYSSRPGGSEGRTNVRIRGAKSGREVWSRDFDGYDVSEPYPGGDTIVLVDRSGTVSGVRV